MKTISERNRAVNLYLRTAIAAAVASNFGSGVAIAEEVAPGTKQAPAGSSSTTDNDAPLMVAQSAPVTAPKTPATTTAGAEGATELDAIQVTGTRIVAPGVVSSSPVYSIEAEEITRQQQPEIERVLRLLPITAPSDGQNANNGSAGAATINLRGLGPQRNLLMINGKRLTPYNIFGLVDTSMIPTALIERIDLITGGASAVYGSDAMSGAINFIMKRDFEGVELTYNHSLTGEDDGKNKSSSLVLGGNIDNGRGNVVLGINWTDRVGVQLGQRPLGLLGIDTATGAGYAQYLAGAPPTPPADPLCQGTGSVAAGGSTTTVPTRVSIAGGPGLGQFRNDGTLGTNCSVFNFNPFNYYQTPQERYGASVIGRFEFNEHAEAYSRIAYGSTSVRQQVAPSGVFATPFFTPLANPFIGTAARNSILTAANTGRVAGTVTTTGAFPNWRDVNANGVVDSPDYLNISYRRRTVELGERSTTYNNDAFQFVVGAQGNIVGAWNYDVSFQRGQSDRTNISAGYTNLTNIGNALNSVDGVNCLNGDPTCVPINLFGGLGTITPAMAAYAGAVGIEKQSYTQLITSATVNGILTGVEVPSANSPIGLSFGVERRREQGETSPDECLKLAPASCLGGAGGNTLPIKGGFEVDEIFGEAIVPLINDMPGAQSLDLELGYRYSDYTPTGVNKTWKYGLSWVPVDSLRFRVMQQRAARAPNVGELAAPRVTALGNATQDPCSIANAANLEAADPNDTALRNLCISTGMTAVQVGTVEDIVSGQINAFAGTDLSNLPQPELADTTTVGFVFTPKLGDTIRNPVLSLDYYDIYIEKVIGTFTPQEVLNGCYVGAQAGECAKIIRLGGTLTLDGSGVQLFTTNLNYLQAEGIELSAGFGMGIGSWGSLRFSTNVNKYLTQESQSSSLTPVLDCAGFYGTSCGGPLPEVRWIQRTTWDFNNLEFSYLWRHIGEVKVEAVEAAGTFDTFRSIGARDYLDLGTGFKVTDNFKLNAMIQNVFDRDPPVVGNEAADTRSNSGNTFPSHYDTLGRVFTLGAQVTF